TRLRLVLWSLARGDEEFPESPPPGLVTIPAVQKVPSAVYLKSGYRRAGERAIRIDMLERLADMLRTEDSRGGFEATPDMLSITGTTLAQFANLMEGLGYKAQRGEREKVRQATERSSPSEGNAAPDAPQTAPETSVPDEPGDHVSANRPEPDPADDGPEIEEFYTFVWSGRRSSQRKGARPQRKVKKAPRKETSKDGPSVRTGRFEARPPKRDRIDPDNPFAQALQGLKNKEA
ncbi:MAG: disulfide oxidoreductase, partial [Boseongicola sp.]|nr:disulfide oxidoreductase [Boseongicola sp.]